MNDEPSSNAAASPPPEAASSRGRPVLFPNAYVWLVFVSSLDVMLTWLILTVGGREINPIADFVIRHGGLQGVVLFKFSAVILVILICEMVGRREYHTGRWLSRAAVAISAIPVVLSLTQLALAFL